MANTSGVWSVLGALVSLGALTGCGPGDFASPTYDFESEPYTPAGYNAYQGNELFAGKTVRANGKVAPIAGGTLLMARDGRAIAADPDRDQLHLVDLKTKQVQSLQLREGDEPGRVVDGPVGVAYVAARRGGVVLAVDTAAGTMRRISVCAAPRGLAYDDAHHQLFVACRSGVLAVVDTVSEEVVQRFRLDPDLRDVLLSGDDLVVSRFKTAELLVVNRSGEVLRRAKPNTSSGGAANVTPSVAYRTLQAPGGGVLVGHVDASDVTLPSGAGAYYGAPCGGSVADPALSMMDPALAVTPAPATAPGPVREPTVALSTRFSVGMGGMAGPLDLAFSPDGAKLAVLSIGNSWELTPGNKKPSLLISEVSQLTAAGQTAAFCGGFGGPNSVDLEGEPVAIAYAQSGGWVVQSREPAQLQLETGEVIALASDARFDTGLAMFHMNTGGGIACTSCHPEAGEDGHTWNFTVGPRRSQSLEGQASARAPFHWSGDLLSFDDLFQEVMVKRMSLAQQVAAEQRTALRDWLDSVPRQDTADDLDAESVARGAELFKNKRVGCATCHSGSDYTDNLAHDVGTAGVFVTPSLVGVNLRAPLFHDGCAVSLVGRFGLCGGGDRHGITSDLSLEQRSDLVAFMQSL